MYRIRTLLSQLVADTRGVAVVLVVLGAVVILGFLGLVVDGGQAYNARRHLQTAADAAALSGAMAKMKGENIAAAVNEYLQANGVDPATQLLNSGSLVDGSRVRVRVNEQNPTTFARVLGINQLTVGASAAATAGYATGVEGEGLLPLMAFVDTGSGATCLYDENLTQVEGQCDLSSVEDWIGSQFGTVKYSEDSDGWDLVSAIQGSLDITLRVYTGAEADCDESPDAIDGEVGCVGPDVGASAGTLLKGFLGQPDGSTAEKFNDGLLSYCYDTGSDYPVDDDDSNLYVYKRSTDPEPGTEAYENTGGCKRVFAVPVFDQDVTHGTTDRLRIVGFAPFQITGLYCVSAGDPGVWVPCWRMAGGEEKRDYDYDHDGSVDNFNTETWGMPKHHTVGQVVLTGTFINDWTSEDVIEGSPDSNYDYGIYKLMLVE